MQSPSPLLTSTDLYTRKKLQKCTQLNGCFVRVGCTVVSNRTVAVHFSGFLD